MKYKQHKLSKWSKQAQITMIKKDISIEKLAEETTYSPQHLNAILNDRVRSDRGRKRISEVLGISSEYD